MLVELPNGDYVDPKEICSMEKDDGGYFEKDSGTIIVLKNGRKILVKYNNPEQLHEWIYSCEKKPADLQSETDEREPG